jgi:biotin carboxyl carrier protein
VTNPAESAAATNGTPLVPPKEKPRVAARWLFAILALTFLFVLMPFLFWQATWFGRPLNDDQLLKSLADKEHPREVQHALSQVADRIMSPDSAMRDSARRFYPQTVAIAQSGGDELRLTAAWVMGQDNSVPEFHQELLRLLNDSNPMVERNAALALIRFGDASGHAQIVAMLQPYAMPSPQTGTLLERMKPGDVINPGTLLGHLETGGQKIEVRSLVPGTVRSWQVSDGAMVQAGEPIMLVDPSSAEVWESLRALYLVGNKEDLPAVLQISQGTGVTTDLRTQAEATAKAIETRTNPK